MFGYIVYPMWCAFFVLKCIVSAWDLLVWMALHERVIEQIHNRPRGRLLCLLFCIARKQSTHKKTKTFALFTETHMLNSESPLNCNNLNITHPNHEERPYNTCTRKHEDVIIFNGLCCYSGGGSGGTWLMFSSSSFFFLFKRMLFK